VDRAAPIAVRTALDHRGSLLVRFVLFDQATRFQIELPGGWQEVQPRIAGIGQS